MVDNIGISPKKSHDPNTAVTGTRKINELAVLEPNLLAAKKYIVVPNVVETTAR